MSPITANCSRFCGVQSTFAPTSSSIAGFPGAVGKTAASAGRSTPGTAPSTTFAVAMAAPVLPAVTKPAACPSRTMRRPTRMEESRLARIASTLSSMVMNSLAWTISMGRRAAAEWRSSSALTTVLRADQQHAQAVLTRREYGALNLRLGSAVRTHRIQRDHARHGVYELAGFFHVEDFASLIVTAFGAGAMRHFFLVTVGALGKAVAPSVRRGRAGLKCASGSVAVLD